MTEVKENSPGKKGVEDEIEFKAGKGMFSNFLYEKLEYKWIKYEVKKIPLLLTKSKMKYTG